MPTLLFSVGKNADPPKRQACAAFLHCGACFFLQQLAAQAQFKLFSGSLRLNGGDSAAALRALRNGAPRVVSEKEGGKKGGGGRFG